MIKTYEYYLFTKDNVKIDNNDYLLVNMKNSQFSEKIDREMIAKVESVISNVKLYILLVDVGMWVTINRNKIIKKLTTEEIEEYLTKKEGEKYNI